MYERILVPLDGSEVAEIALDHAAALARLTKSTLVLLRAVIPFDAGEVVPTLDPTEEPDGPTFSFKAGSIEGDAQAADEYLANLKGKLSAEQIQTHCVTALGAPADEILNCAANSDISLIVMSTHGHGGLSPHRFGSVAELVVTGTQIPEGAGSRLPHASVLVIPHR